VWNKRKVRARRLEPVECVALKLGELASSRPAHRARLAGLRRSISSPLNYPAIVREGAPGGEAQAVLRLTYIFS